MAGRSRSAGRGRSTGRGRSASSGRKGPRPRRQEPLDPALYARAVAEVDRVYKVPSAYRSGAIVQAYRRLGGRYRSTSQGRGAAPLRRWFRERWADVNPRPRPGSYPVYRPTVRVTARTPLTVDEVSPADLARKARLKQRLREKGRLPPFRAARVARAARAN